MSAIPPPSKSPTHHTSFTVTPSVVPARCTTSILLQHFWRGMSTDPCRSHCQTTLAQAGKVGADDLAACIDECRKYLYGVP